MSFNSVTFFIFLIAFLLIYYLCPYKYKRVVLFVGSLIFYFLQSPIYLFLLLFVIIFSYYAALKIESSTTEKQKKRLCYISVITILLILISFKYLLPWIINNITTLKSLLDSLNFITTTYLNSDVITFILPVGISFYSFQTMGYVMDVYRGSKAEKDFIIYATFISFFPQLVAGPIERSKTLLTQLRNIPVAKWRDFQEGFCLMLYGYFCKIVIADRVSIFVNKVYGDPSLMSGSVLALATLLFAIQLYCDFHGYSLIAKGIAKVIGIDLINNFHAPYYSNSFSSFWNNWHMSLSTWFRDYVYIPLGGNRHGKLIKYRNTMIVFLLSGAWHGSGLTYIVWGFLNGCYLIVEDMLSYLGFKHHTHNRIVTVFQTLIVFTLVCFGYIFFRSVSMSQSLLIIKKIFTDFNIANLLSADILRYGLNMNNWIVLLLSILFLGIVDSYTKRNIILRDKLIDAPPILRVCFLAIAFCFIFTVGIWGPGYSANLFIYFQF